MREGQSAAGASGPKGDADASKAKAHARDVEKLGDGARDSGGTKPSGKTGFLSVVSVISYLTCSCLMLLVNKVRNGSEADKNRNRTCFLFVR